MSTRASVYYEDNGIHVFQDLADSGSDQLWLEYERGPFSITLTLGPRLSHIIRGGLADERIRAKVAKLRGRKRA